MQHKRVIEILIGVLSTMSNVASIVALVLYQPIPGNAQNTIDAAQMIVINVLLGAGTFITAYLLIRSSLVPKFISILGLIGSALIFLRGILISLGLFGQTPLLGVALLIPFFGYKTCLGLFMFSKGFTEVKLPPPLKQNLFQLSKKNNT